MGMQWWRCVAPSACAVAVMCAIGVARAGGTTDSGGSSDGTTESGSGEETSTSTDGTTGADTGLESDSSCGECSPGANGAVVFVTPDVFSPVVASPFWVEVRAELGCDCDDCGCFDSSAEGIRLELDGVAYGEPCSGSSCSFEVVASQGPHELTATAQYLFYETSATLQITVEGWSDEGPGTEGSASGESSGGSAGEQDEDDGGCACSAGASGPSAGVSALLLLIAFARRRARVQR